MSSNNILKILSKFIKLQTIFGNISAQKEALKVIEKNLPSIFSAEYLSNKNIHSAYFYPNDKKKVDILLSAHIDVVPAKKEMFRLKKRGDKLFGRGTFDMKGPLVGLIESLRLYYQNSDKLNIGLLVTSDEEKGGFNGTKYFLDKNKLIKPKVVIIPDGGNNFEIVVEEKGILNIELSYQGKSAHSARPWEGDNAVIKLLKVLNKIIKRFPSDKESNWKTTATISFIETKAEAGNVVPCFAKAKINFRFIDKDNPQKILNFIKKLNKKIKIKINVCEKALKISLADKYLHLFKNTIKSCTNKLPELKKYHSTCDARFFTERNIPVIISRPLGGGAHAENEWISFKNLNKFVEILIDFYKKLENEK